MEQDELDDTQAFPAVMEDEMEPPNQPIEVVSLHGQQAQLTSIELASMQDQASDLLCSFGREVAAATGVTWTTVHEDRARLLVGALVDAAEERLADAIIELTREMLADRPPCDRH